MLTLLSFPSAFSLGALGVSIKLSAVPNVFDPLGPPKNPTSSGSSCKTGRGGASSSSGSGTSYPPRDAGGRYFAYGFIEMRLTSFSGSLPFPLSTRKGGDSWEGGERDGEGLREEGPEVEEGSMWFGER